MSSEHPSPAPPPNPQPPAPPQSAAHSPWQRAKFILKAAEVRLRFIAVLVGIGLAIAYWDTIQNYWDRWTRPHAAVAEESDTEYFCPMHPQVVRPGLDPGGQIPHCPICGMPLSKRKKSEASALSSGAARVQLSPERIQMAGVKTETVDYQPLVKEIRTVGFVDYDESKLSKIVTRTKGFIEKLFVDKTFMTVEAGQPLAELYSPEIYTSAQELQLAKKYNDTRLVEAGRERLRLMGISDQEIDPLLKSTDARPTIIIRAPHAGHVIQKNVVAGSAVDAGATLFEIADLSTVWIEAEVFEKDVGLLHTGQDIEATVDALPGEVFRGQVALVHPHLETATRTNRVRLLLANPDHKLRPGMFATVLIKTPLAEMEPFRSAAHTAHDRPTAQDDAALIAFQKVCPVTGRQLGSMGTPVKMHANSQTVFLCCTGCVDEFQKNTAKYLAKLAAAAAPTGSVLAVPEQAVIDTGSQTLVYVEREPGVFEAVEVKLGPRSDNFYSVIDGLSAGDRVAAAGAFLIDAETRLNPAAASGYFGASGAERGASPATTAPNTSPSPQHQH